MSGKQEALGEWQNQLFGALEKVDNGANSSPFSLLGNESLVFLKDEPEEMNPDEGELKGTILFMDILLVFQSNLSLIGFIQ